MRIVKFIALAGLLAMTGILIYGFTVGNFSVEGAKLLAMPWGIVSLVDLYVGFTLFSCWIVFREKAWLPSVIWVILMMVLGFWVGALYTFFALQTSGGDWKHFWYGKRIWIFIYRLSLTQRNLHTVGRRPTLSAATT